MSRTTATQGDDIVARMTALIDEYGVHLEAAGYSSETVTCRIKLLRRVEAALPMGLAPATTEELESFLARRTWSRQTKATYYGHLVGFFRWASAGPDPRLDYDPSAGLIRAQVPKHVPKPVTNAELAAALDRLPARWRIVALIAAYSGARCCELVRLHRQDIDEQGIRLLGKGSKVRVVPTHPLVWAAVRDLPAGLIAPRVDGKPGRLTPNALSVGMVRALERAGVRGASKVSTHKFRHWLATTALRPVQFGGGGASLRTVQELLGHASVATTAGYTLVADEERVAAIGALPAIGPVSS